MIFVTRACAGAHASTATDRNSGSQATERSATLIRTSLVPGGQLRELDQAVLRRLGVDEGDARAGVADARLLVEQRYPLGLQLGQRLVDVLDFEADVVQPALAFRHHALVLAVGALAGDQLDHRLADVVERELAPVVLLHAAERD